MIIIFMKSKPNGRTEWFSLCNNYLYLGLTLVLELDTIFVMK